MNEPAKIVYEDNDIDIGTVFIEDTEKVIEFKISNGGGRSFYLRDVVSSCDCTHAEYSDENVLGGESTTVKVTLNPSLLQEGAFERMIGVYSSLKNRPDTLYFHGVAKHK
jgi:hypothetical protein